MNIIAQTWAISMQAEVYLSNSGAFAQTTIKAVRARAVDA